MPNPFRKPRTWAAGGLIALASALAAATLAAQAPEPPPPAAAARALVIDAIEVEGNHRTDAVRIVAAAGLHPGDAVDAGELLLAAERVRRRFPLRDARVHTKRGSAPGQLVVVLTVDERPAHFRLGLGYEDLSGWYLLPLQLNLDNLTGRGERADVSLRFGLRVAGLVARYRRPSATDPRRYWELRTRVEAQDRLYFAEGTEIRHPVGRAGLDFTVARPTNDALSASAWVSVDAVDVDSTAVVHRARESIGKEEGDEVPFADLPASIQSAVGDRVEFGVGIALEVDTRRGRGLAQRGWWGRTWIEATGAEITDGARSSYASWNWDLRRYVDLAPGTQLAVRTRAGAIGAEAPFDRRFYLGGLYTVRGYPSQSLSPAGGYTGFATASIELRQAWTGGSLTDPRVVALAFADVGGGSTGEVSRDAAAVGVGARVRVPWIGHLGLDLGFPLSERPVDEGFHANLSIGWTY